jgi:hypothetical protein
MSVIPVAAVILIVVVASFGLYGTFSSEHKAVLPPLPVIIRTTPQAYMEVNFSNLSHSSEIYAISFTGVTKNISLSSIELKALNGSSTGIVHLNDNYSLYTLNMSPSSTFNITVSGGSVLSDSTSIVMKYFKGEIQTFTSIEILDVANDVSISQAVLSQNLSQNSSITPVASMAVSERSSGGMPQCYALSFSNVTKTVSMSAVILEIYNGSINGTIRFSSNSSQYEINMSSSSHLIVTVYGGNVFSGSTYITIKFSSGAKQTLTMVKLTDYNSGGAIVSATL